MRTLATQYAREWFGGVGRGAMLCRDIASSLCRARVKWNDVLYQMYFIGVKSQSVVAITGAFTGMVLCAQTAFQFHKVKMDTATLAVVSVGMDRLDGGGSGRGRHCRRTRHHARYRTNRRLAHPRRQPH
jgi:phospholipid/cholesterol/gamma-HCH transport system permease protein